MQIFIYCFLNLKQLWVEMHDMISLNMDIDFCKFPAIFIDGPTVLAAGKGRSVNLF